MSIQTSSIGTEKKIAHGGSYSNGDKIEKESGSVSQKSSKKISVIYQVQEVSSPLEPTVQKKKRGRKPKNDNIQDIEDKNRKRRCLGTNNDELTFNEGMRKLK